MAVINNSVCDDFITYLEEENSHIICRKLKHLDISIALLNYIVKNGFRFTENNVLYKSIPTDDIERIIIALGLENNLIHFTEVKFTIDQLIIFDVLDYHDLKKDNTNLYVKSLYTKINQYGSLDDFLAHIKDI